MDLSWIATDASDDGALTPTGVDVIGASSTAIDHDTGEIYWTNAIPYGEIAATRGLFRMPLAGGAGNQVGSDEVGGASGGLLILKVPQATSEPVLTGGTTVGSELACGDVTWAGDRPEAHYFRSPVTREVAWSYNGLPIADATSETLVADKPGKYRCARAGTNAAGSDATISNEIEVTDPTPVCPAIKLSVQISKFSPGRPYGKRNAPGVRVTFRTSGNLIVNLKPKITFNGKGGKRVASLQRHQINVHSRQRIRFLLPSTLTKAIVKERGKVHRAPVTFSARAEIWRPGSRDCSQKQDLKLKTKVFYVSSRPGIGLRRR